jgi:hypothetical protein
MSVHLSTTLSSRLLRLPRNCIADVTKFAFGAAVTPVANNAFGAAVATTPVANNAFGAAVATTPVANNAFGVTVATKQLPLGT